MLTTDSKKTDPLRPDLTLSCLCLPIYRIGLMHFANVEIFFFGKGRTKTRNQKKLRLRFGVWNIPAEFEQCSFVPRICKWEVCLFQGAC